jgi:DNA-directed RNA polymerase specialized sigma24 family protein
MSLELSGDLPLELRQVLARAGAGVAGDPEHNLPPVYRRAIYAIWGYADPASPRGWLALITARRVADLWQAAGRRLLAGDLLGVIEGILRGRLSPVTGRQAAQAAWRQLVSAPPTPDPRALDAAQAALQAMSEVLGADPFHAVSLRNTVTDAELDPVSSDAARWAAAAYSGSDPRRRGEFWQWWLYEAVPLAWNSGAGTPGRDAIVRPKVW